MHPPHDRAGTGTADPAEALIRAHYEDFNQRRLDAAAARFHPDARIEHPTGQIACGADGFRVLAHQWLTAFPDCHLRVETIRPQGRGMYEVDLAAAGTHTGTLAFGSWVFRPSHVAVRLPARELFQVEDAVFRIASLSFDLQDLVRQLAQVDTARLQQSLGRIHLLGEQLAAERDPGRQRELIDRLGNQLDAARQVVRPYFRMNQ